MATLFAAKNYDIGWGITTETNEEIEWVIDIK